MSPQQSTPAKRYFLAVMPSGWYGLAVSEYRLRFAYAEVEGRAVRFVEAKSLVPVTALAVSDALEVERREARRVMAMVSGLVPLQFYLAQIALRIDAVEQVLPFYVEAGAHDQAEKLRWKLARLLRRRSLLARRLHAPYRPRLKPITPVHFGPLWSAWSPTLAEPSTVEA